ncbi:phosphatidylglycerophosphatase A family protein [Candidatus Fokinia crypta]|nr:phosphatidylglycerophosphatase A [Candidatus Fokinia cryptica]
MKTLIFSIYRKIAYKFAIILNTCFGVGYFPVASGTIGTLVGFPIYVAVRVMHYSYWKTVIMLFGIGVLIFIIGLISITFWKNNGKISKEKVDNSSIVIDEVLGIIVCLSICFHDLIFLSEKLHIEMLNSYFTEFAIAFVFFRIFDIIKPFPIYKIDMEMHNAFGVMLDDVVAGIYAGLSILATRYLIELLLNVL